MSRLVGDKLVVNWNRVERLIVMSLLHRLQMMVAHLTMEVDGARRRMTSLARSNLVKHRHVVVLILGPGPGLSMLAELLLADVSR